MTCRSNVRTFSVRPQSFLRELGQLVEDFLLGREATLVMLGENRALAHGHCKHPATSSHEATLHAKGLLDLSRQTGGSR